MLCSSCPQCLSFPVGKLSILVFLHCISGVTAGTMVFKGLWWSCVSVFPHFTWTKKLPKLVILILLISCKQMQIPESQSLTLRFSA